jgi:hypothetical protein
LESFQIQFPAWYILLCIAAGALFSLVLYYRDRTFQDHRAYVKTIMAILRFATVTLLAALLLAPFLQMYEQTIQEPVVIIAQDNSSSIGDFLEDEDSIAYVAAIDKLALGLNGKFTVERLKFGTAIEEGADPDFGDRVTDISQLLEYAGKQYGDQNLGAVIIATDGLYNRGKNPLYLSQDMSAPLYVVALGDTTVRTDLRIQQVLHNRISFLGDKFPIQVDIAARKLAGRDATISIQRISGSTVTTLKQESIKIDSDYFFDTREFMLDADQSGVNRYRVRLSGISGEEQYANNLKDIYIEVIDGRMEILVLGSAPHPDLAALREIISTNENYNVTASLFSDFEGNAANFDLVILHQLPDAKHNITPLLTTLDNARVPRIFIIGEGTLMPKFNDAQDLLSITGGTQNSNEVTALIEPQFQLFTIQENFENQIRTFAPLNAPFGEYSVNPAANVYLYQKIGNVDTRFPLMLFGESGGLKSGVLAAEGIWKWRLYDYLQNGSQDLTNTLINKAIQYVTVKDDRRKFRASPSKNLFNDDEQITFSAELYNQSYELINDSDVFLIVRDGDEKEYSYTFNKTSHSYAISIGRFAVGEYRFTAFTDYGGKRLKVNGRFTVKEIQLESYTTTADHNMLYTLSAKYGGEVVYPNSLDRLSEQLLSSNDLKPVIYQSVRNKPLLQIRWLFFGFLLLLTVEWFMRRYLGGY